MPDVDDTSGILRSGSFSIRWPLISLGPGPGSRSVPGRRQREATLCDLLALYCWPPAPHETAQEAPYAAFFSLGRCPQPSTDRDPCRKRPSQPKVLNGQSAYEVDIEI
jgi:hypothetical protein